MVFDVSATTLFDDTVVAESQRLAVNERSRNHHHGPQMYLDRWAAMSSSSQFRSTPARCIVRNRPTRCA